MSEPLVLITGAAGQVGQALLDLAPAFPCFRLLPASRQALDITDPGVVDRFFSAHPVRYCINCAAYTAVDKAETEPEQARLVNVDGTANLARACRHRGAALLHLSSDYVYHNALNRPLKEDDPTEPAGVYARTKLEGERQAMTLHHQTMVIRSSWIYGISGQNFVKTMLRLGRERGQLRVVYDQVGAPTYAADLARALLIIVEQIDRGLAGWPGIYNYANEGVTSWYDFSKAIFEISGTECRVEPVLSRDFPTPAKRPHFSVLDKEKIKSTFGLDIPQWRESLHRCLKQFHSPE